MHVIAAHVDKFSRWVIQAPVATLCDLLVDEPGAREKKNESKEASG
jgi:hypothetical protein